MSKIELAVMDAGEANRRILNKDEYRADFRRVEAASLKRKTRLASAEGKRIFARCFYSFQASLYFVSVLGRTKVPHEYVEQIEQAVRNKMDQGTKELNLAIDGAELLFKNHNIETVATYDTVPLEVEVGITSALGRRYFELIHKLDQLMPLLQTLEIEEVITEKQVEQQRSRFKRIVLAMSSMTRNFAMGCRRRMNDADAKKADAAARNHLGRPAEAADVEAQTEGTAMADAAATPAGIESADQADADIESTLPSESVGESVVRELSMPIPACLE
jgi:Transcriptional regulator AcaB